MKIAVVLVSLVLIVQNTYGACICGLNPCGHASENIFNERDMCRNSEPCEPMVVRPRDLPKPLNPSPILGLTAVPGPCIHKKAIVKPAVVPKPVLKNQQSCIDCSRGGYQHHISHHGYSSYGHQEVISTGGSSVLNGGSCAGTFDGSMINGGAVVNGGGFINGGLTPVGGTPADAVSVALAYKMARQQHAQQSLSEDKLSFGFRKLPIEVPQKRITKPNVPEENLFNLNGQIVELKPVNLDTQKSLDEEAADDLLALEEEEDDDVANKRQVRKIYLEEIGYAPASVKSGSFVDVPQSVIAGVGEAAASAATSVSNTFGCGGNSNCKDFLPGGVEYRVVPDLNGVQPDDSCESAELDIPQEKTCECQCKCMPMCIKKCHHCQKSSVFMQKLGHM